MIIGLFLLLIILCINPFSLLSLLEPVLNILGETCLQRVKEAGREEWQTIYSALICGKRLEAGEIKRTFLSLGIIHLMVISGAHLIFLERLWGLLPRFRFKEPLLACFLLLYSMTAGLRPPILRALFSLLLKRINKEKKLFWSPYLRVQMSGILCLLCQNNWFHSLSLQLSWIASMGMSNHRLSRLSSCTLTFLLVLPIISRWGNPHPFSIVINWLIAPLAGSILLPFSMLVIPFPALRPLTDQVWSYFMFLLLRLARFMENQGLDLGWSFNSFQIWIYISVVFVLLQLFFVSSGPPTTKEVSKSWEGL